jgi:hypothetical protein
MRGRIGKHNDEIIALYNSGEGISDIAIALALHWSNVYVILKNHDLLSDRKDLRIPEIQKLLRKGMDPEEMRKKYHLDRWKVKKAVLYETGKEYEPDGIKETEPQLQENEIDETNLTRRTDTRQIRHMQIGGKRYADMTDYYNETGGAGW